MGDRQRTQKKKRNRKRGKVIVKNRKIKFSKGEAPQIDDIYTGEKSASANAVIGDALSSGDEDVPITKRLI